MTCSRNLLANKFLVSLNHEQNCFSVAPVINIVNDDSDSASPPLVHVARLSWHRSPTSVEMEDPQTQSDTVEEMRYNVPNSHSIFSFLTYPTSYSIEANTSDYNDTESSKWNKQLPSSQTRSITVRSKWQSSNQQREGQKSTPNRSTDATNVPSP